MSFTEVQTIFGVPRKDIAVAESGALKSVRRTIGVTFILELLVLGFDLVLLATSNNFIGEIIVCLVACGLGVVNFVALDKHGKKVTSPALKLYDFYIRYSCCSLSSICVSLTMTERDEVLAELGVVPPDEATYEEFIRLVHEACIEDNSVAVKVVPLLKRYETSSDAAQVFGYVIDDGESGVFAGFDI